MAGLKREKKSRSTNQDSRQDAAPQQNRGPIPLAIVGIGCRYPGVSNAEELWRKLLAGEDLVGHYRGPRFPELDALYDQARRAPNRILTDRGGFLEDVAGFDSQFFEISPRESVYLDPQHRLLLEVAWEALEDAGQVREKYKNSATGVYVGLWTSEYEERLYESASEPDFYSVTGCGRASASGRLSFAFGLQGPGVTVDSACSSSLVAVHMACQALWAGEIDMALAGGANLILGTEITELFTKAKMLSPDGRCKFGDASADGFVRSEGAGIVVLKTLARAIAENDPIYALIRGGAVNNDGRSSGFMAPSREGQQQMLRAAWQSAAIDPGDIRFIEMHGTGTSVGDPVEIGAVGAALAECGVSQPCVLGSVKTNLGHTESASGVTGLIKAALALKHRILPPGLHLSVPNPKIAWDELPVRIATEAVNLSSESGPGFRPLIAGVNSFGLSGTNAHIVLEAAETKLAGSPRGSGPYLLPISARTPEALQAMLRAHLAAMETGGAGYPIGDVCYTATLRRTHQEYRAAIVGENLDDLKMNLAAAAANEDAEGAVSGRIGAGERKIVFVAPGQGSQWVGMARELFASEPVFRQAFEGCDAAIAAETGWTLADRVLGPEADRYLTQIDVIQPALFAMSVALAAVWRSWGIQPDTVVGHSMGEVAAAHIAGVLNLKDAVAVICRRSRLMKTLSSAGSMATVELPLKEVEKLLQSEPGISVGASNGPHTTVISGDSKAVEALLKKLDAKEIYCRQIKVDVASHSSQVDPILEELRNSLADVRPQAARIPMLSTVTGEYASETDGTAMDAAYWAENLRRSVLFAPAVEKLCADGQDVFIELSPHPILLPSMEASARPVNPRALAVGSLRREKSERATMLRGLAALYAAGCKLDWTRLYPSGGRCVSLPQYQFQRERYWPEQGDSARKRTATLQGGNASPLLGRKFESSLQPNALLWETDLQIASVPYLDDHRVLRSAVFPASGHIEMALSAAKSLAAGDIFEVRNASFSSAAYIPDAGSKTFQLALTPDGDGTFTFEIRTRADEGEAAWPLRSSGTLHRVEANSVSSQRLLIADLKHRYPIRRSGQEHYERTSKSGLQYGPAFQLVQEAWVGDGECLCRVRNSVPQGSSSVIHPAVLDACFQAMAHVRPELDAFQAADTYLPVLIEKIRVRAALPDDGDLFAQAKLVGADAAKGTLRADLCLADANGNVLVDVSGLELMRVARETAQTNAAEWLYSMEWVRDHSPNEAEEKAQTAIALLPKLRSANWLVFADRKGIADGMRTLVVSGGGRCTLVRAGSKFRKIADAEFEIDPSEPRDLDRLLEETAIDTGVPTAVVDMWALNRNSREKYDAERLIRSQRLGSKYVPRIVQAIARANWQNPPRLWLVTAGAMPAGDGRQPIQIENAPMWGIGRAVAREHAELQTTLVDLSSTPEDREARALAIEICANGKEDRIALRAGEKYVARLKHFVANSAAPESRQLRSGEEYRVEIPTAGILDNLELRAFVPASPASGEVAIEVVAAGLNFIDVAKAMGIYPGLDPAQPARLGGECSGRIATIGEGASGLKVGDEVIAVTSSMRDIGTMASRVLVPVEMIFPRPKQLSWEQAATTPLAFLTAYYSLVELARIRRGEWVLIHAGAGGVGLAAIEIAKSYGANIIATVGSTEKANYLRSLGVTHILNSRSLDFAPGVMSITSGRGVDIVLNSLTGEFISAGLEVLAPYGRFIELGKRDIYDDRHIGLKVFRKNLSFHAVDLAAAIEEKRSYVVEMLGEVMRRIQSGEWKPLPVTSFPSVDPSEPFRFMAQARHIGKISVRMDRDVRVLPESEKPLFSANASYLITGGLGGVALTVAEWMAKNGAGHLALLSRRAVSEQSRAAIRRMEENGAAVTTFRADVTNEADLTKALETIHASGMPLKGIMHTAAVVDDALISDVTPERFVPVMAPKIVGAWNLHAATLKDDLDFFALFSSIAAIHPQPGMGSYAAANAFLDAFAHYLRGLGRPAISINWGGWDQIGLARAAGTGRSIEGYSDEGMRVFSGDEALEALRSALESNPVQVMAVPIDADRFAEFHGPNDIPPAFADLVSQSQTKTATQTNRSAVLEQLAAVDSTKQRHEILEAHLQDVLGRVLKLAAHKIDRERALGSMGLDSLMGLEFVRRLSNSLEIAVPATVVFNYPTIQLLAAHLLQRMHLNIADTAKTADAHSTIAIAPDGRNDSLRELSDELSEEDALQALIGTEIGNGMGNGQRGS
jgi:acyl transferase domain-containing protein/acyl carrier protein